jgi:hypothetical protein
MPPVRLLLCAIAFAAAAAPLAARADTPGDSTLPPAPARDARNEAPVVAYAYSAYGAPAGTGGALGYGLGLVGPGQRATGGGGVTVWGSPFDRLTLVGDALRDVYLLDHFAPSAAAIVRLAGGPGDGWSLAALGKYKVEGFGSDGNGDMESELEGGMLLSYARDRLHLDANGITGFGLTDDGEIDAELRLRGGYDLLPVLRVGADGQGRYRLSGSKALPGNRTWDFAGGPQIVVGRGHVFGSLTAGPTTMGITAASVVGWTAVASVGGAI